MPSRPEPIWPRHCTCTRCVRQTARDICRQTDRKTFLYLSSSYIVITTSLHIIPSFNSPSPRLPVSPSPTPSFPPPQEDNCELINKRWGLFDALVAQGKWTNHEGDGYQLAMLWASAGNTVPACFWVLYYLLRTPQIAQAVRAEIRQVQGDSPDVVMTQAQLNDLVMLDACITETMRLVSGSLIMRVVQRPCTLTLASGNTYSFRQGDRVGIAPPITHRDSEVYTEAHLFNPKRWLTGATPEERALGALGKIPVTKGGRAINPSMAYLPFGGAVPPIAAFRSGLLCPLLVYFVLFCSMLFYSPSSTYPAPSNRIRLCFLRSTSLLFVSFISWLPCLTPSLSIAPPSSPPHLSSPQAAPPTARAVASLATRSRPSSPCCSPSSTSPSSTRPPAAAAVRLSAPLREETCSTRGRNGVRGSTARAQDWASSVRRTKCG